MRWRRRLLRIEIAEGAQEIRITVLSAQSCGGVAVRACGAGKNNAHHCCYNEPKRTHGKPEGNAEAAFPPTARVKRITRPSP